MPLYYYFSYLSVPKYGVTYSSSDSPQVLIKIPGASERASSFSAVEKIISLEAREQDEEKWGKLLLLSINI